MRVCVAGLWHLGSVSAACLARAGHDVVGLDPDPRVIEALSAGRPPVMEPGLPELVQEGIAAGRLRFTSDPADALRAVEVVWITYDTPVDEDDHADVDYVVDRVRALFPSLPDGVLVLVSSQLPVGSTARLEREFADHARGRVAHFAYSPENLRLGKAIDVFTRPDRVVAGVRSEVARARITALLGGITDRFEWMGVESAEMTKHALNAFLATSVAFINEVAAICERVGADASEVARGLKSEVRIGPGAYLSPGGAFAGGTLARDVQFLAQLGDQHGVPLSLLPGIKRSNDAHRHWAERRLTDLLGSVHDRRVAVWGLTYKPGTDTLRRSSAIELCRALAGAGATVSAHDPAVRALPLDLPRGIELRADPLAAVDEASALVVCTPWPEYRRISAADVLDRMARPLVLDPNRFLAETFERVADAEYVSVGRVAHA
jgi:UDPglucose 6-dehydrogenase